MNRVKPDSRVQKVIADIAEKKESKESSKIELANEVIETATEDIANGVSVEEALPKSAEKAGIPIGPITPPPCDPSTPDCPPPPPPCDPSTPDCPPPPPPPPPCDPSTPDCPPPPPPPPPCDPSTPDCPPPPPPTTTGDNPPTLLLPPPTTTGDNPPTLLLPPIIDGEHHKGAINKK